MPAARAARRAGTASASLRCTTWARPPVSPVLGDDQGDRGLLGSARPGGEEAGVVGAVERALVEQVAVLGVHDHQCAEPGGLLHGQRELLRLEVPELVDARVEQEALEAEHPGLVQRLEVGDVAGHRAGPEADVDQDLPPGHQPLDLERRDRGGRRDRVQRHVEDGGDPAGRGRPGRGGEPLPLGATRFVDVHVGVDQAGQQHLVVLEVDRPRRGRCLVVRRHDGDPLPRDPDRGRDLGAVHDRPAGADDQIELSCHGRWSIRRG